MRARVEQTATGALDNKPDPKPQTHSSSSQETAHGEEKESTPISVLICCSELDAIVMKAFCIEVRGVSMYSLYDHERQRPRMRIK
jgi:hypothetical protein